MSEAVTVFAAGLLFDNDGTLVDSTPSVDRSWRRWAAHYGVPDAERLQIAHGTRAIDIMQKLVPGIDTEAGLKLIEDIEVGDIDDLVVLPGTKALLESLPADRWAIVTSATHRLMVVRLEAAGLPVHDHLVTADKVVNGKPHPEPYIKGAELLGVPAAECIVFEDAPSGVRAGKEAGARVIAVLTTHNAEQLRAAGADWIVNSLADVKAEPAEDGVRLTIAAL